MSGWVLLAEVFHRATRAVLDAQCDEAREAAFPQSPRSRVPVVLLSCASKMSQLASQDWSRDLAWEWHRTIRNLSSNTKTRRLLSYRPRRKTNCHWQLQGRSPTPNPAMPDGVGSTAAGASTGAQASSSSPDSGGSIRRSRVNRRLKKTHQIFYCIEMVKARDPSLGTKGSIKQRGNGWKQCSRVQDFLPTAYKLFSNKSFTLV